MPQEAALGVRRPKADLWYYPGVNLALGCTYFSSVPHLSLKLAYDQNKEDDNEISVVSIHHASWTLL